MQKEEQSQGQETRASGQRSRAQEGFDISGLTMLRADFPAHQIGQLPKGTQAQNQCPAAEKRNCTVCGGWHHPKIRHLSYVGHAAITDRLLDADPAWYWQPLAYDEKGLPLFDASGGLWIKLTVCGVTRLGYGNAKQKGSGDGFDPGNREKEVIGDALRNAGMRFGMGLELWHKGDLHADEEEHVEPEVKKAVQEQTPEDLAVWLLAGFENCMTVEQVEKTKELIRAEWPKIKGVKNIKESVAACVSIAMTRVRVREPGEEG